MHMLRYLLSLTLLACAAAVFGQLVLRPNGTVDLPAGPWADTVLIAYDAQLPVGTLRRMDGNGNQRAVHAVFDEQHSGVLKGLLGKGLVAFEEQEVLLLKVNLLRVDIIGSDALCVLHAEVISRSDGVLQRLFESSVKVTTKNCGYDAECYEQNIQRALQGFLDLYRDRPSSTPAEISSEELHTPFLVDAANTAVFASDPPERGLYRDFMQFRMNSPDALVPFALRETVSSPGNMRIVKLKGFSNAAVDSLWGLSDGGNLYIRVGKEFMKIDRNDLGYRLYVRQASSYDPSAIVLGGMFFGVVGAGIVGVATSNKPPPILCDVDMLSGELTPSRPKKAGQDLAWHYFQLSRFTKTADTLVVASDGMEPVTLLKGQWTVLKFPPTADLKKVTITGPWMTETVSIDTNSDKEYVHLISVNKDGSIQITELKDQLRKSTLDKLSPQDHRPSGREVPSSSPASRHLRR